MRRLIVVLGLLAACGGDTAGAATTALPTTTSLPPETTTTVAVVDPPHLVVGITSGRGDDNTFEVTVWFYGPVSTADRLVVGVDGDDSYPGAGDPSGHFEAWAEFGRLITIGADGRVVASGSSEAVADRFSWGADGSVLRAFFIGDFVPVSGTVWVVVGAGSEEGSIAGVPTGEGCSIQGSGLPFPAGSEVPDSGLPCRYP